MPQPCPLLTRNNLRGPKITASTPNLVVCDSMGEPIDEILLTEGHANFYVKAIDEVVDGTLTISTAGAKNKTVSWTKINIKVPPVPQIEAAYIYDRTGDGRADSIWIKFNKPLGGQSVLDSLKFIFGESFDDAYHVSYKDGDMDVSLVAEGDGFGTSIFTGGDTKAYNGKVNIWYTYTDPEDGKTAIFPVDGALTDKVGPVIIAAEVKYLKDGNTQLMLNFSEGLDESNAGVELFRFHCWKNDVLDSAVKAAGDIGTMPANVWKLIFPKGSDADIIPAVGDSVRFRPPSQLGEAKDLQGVLPHELNPWVRITGEQKVTVTSPKVVTLEPGTEMFDSARVIIRNPNATVPKLVGGDKVLSADQVAEIYRQVVEQQVKGPHGDLIRIEMFCHGALCMAISGKCYMSLDNTGRSANRGACMQICRRSYIVTDAETGTQLEIDNKYIMSPKDLKTVRFIDRMMKSGVRVFKIEGRARGPEYVYTVVKTYKEAIHSVLDGTFTEEKKVGRMEQELRFQRYRTESLCRQRA